MAAAALSIVVLGEYLYMLPSLSVQTIFIFFFCNFAKQKLGGCLFLLSNSARAGVSHKMRSSVLRKFIVAAALLSFISDKQTLPGLLGSMSEGIYWEVVWV